MSNNVDKWNQRYRSGNDTIPEPALVLKSNDHLLPAQGDALDLACGLGGNALYMAKKGLTVSAWDFSSAAIDTLGHSALTDNLNICAEVRDITLDPPCAGSFDVIVVSYYLDRSITNFLINALKPGGLLILGAGEVFSWEHPQLETVKSAESNLAFRRRLRGDA